VDGRGQLTGKRVSALEGNGTYSEKGGERVAQNSPLTPRIIRIVIPGQRGIRTRAGQRWRDSQGLWPKEKGGESLRVRKTSIREGKREGRKSGDHGKNHAFERFEGAIPKGGRNG